jgi:hypothetical protein
MPSRLWPNPHRILIPVRRHGHEDFPRADVDTCGIRLQKGTVFQRHPFSSPPPFALADRCLLFSGFYRLLLLTRHRFNLFRSDLGQVAQRKVLF